VRRLIIRGALRPVLVGFAAGFLASWWCAQFLQTFVVDVDARDPWTLSLVAAVLHTTTVAAVWLPARRASHVAPTTVLRAT
jgi:ABC-type lipoprotein release transport system permease subunit